MRISRAGRVRFGLAAMIGTAAAAILGLCPAIALAMDNIVVADIAAVEPVAAAPTPADPTIGNPSQDRRRPDEPFGLTSSFVENRSLKLKWEETQRLLNDDTRTIRDCEQDPDHCDSSGALRMAAIVSMARGRLGLAQLGEVNRAINLAVKPASDLQQYGVPDRWAAPLETLARQAGDCEDYAIAKYLALKMVGIDEDRLRLVIVFDTKSGEDHALVSVRFEDEWLILDNKRMLMLADSQLKQYRPLYSLSGKPISAATAGAATETLSSREPSSVAR